jgi:hypothetical protein
MASKKLSHSFYSFIYHFHIFPMIHHLAAAEAFKRRFSFPAGINIFSPLPVREVDVCDAFTRRTTTEVARRERKNEKSR